MLCESALPVIVFLHGESYEWNSGNPYDGSVLAGYGHVIVVTLNFRLGVLGFLKTGAMGSAQGNFGLMDVVAALHWLRENLPAFGGDPARVTLLGHGSGAALANLVAVSSVAKELVRRVVLLSGSALSPWAVQRDPLAVKRRVAEHTGCHGDLLAEDLAPCLRDLPLAALLAVPADAPRFLPGFAPFLTPADASSEAAEAAAAAAEAATRAAAEEAAPAWRLAADGDSPAAAAAADFPDRDLLFGLTTTESYLDLSAQDLEFGFNESRRDRILRTFVRNAYLYHLNEIFSTLKNEYTDWERPVQLPLNVRDATLELLSDGHTAAPLLRVGFLHAARPGPGRTYFLHFCHQAAERDFPQRTGSVRGEDVPYVLGLPLAAAAAGALSPQQHNFSRQDAAVSRLLMRYLANFARTGDPNSGPGEPPPFWDTYDAINQLYLALGVGAGAGSSQADTKSHYRGHKMSVWLNLIPQLHRPGGSDLSMRHHHFQEEGAQFYDGSVRPQTLQRPAPPPPPPTEPPCPPNATTTGTAPGSDGRTPPDPGSSLLNQGGGGGGGLLRRLASSHYQSYTAALSVTIAVGCCLLLLNVLIFAGIYRQRGAGRRARRDKEEEKKMAAVAAASAAGDAAEATKIPLAGNEMPLREFRSSPSKRCCPGASTIAGSGSIPDPPPPPKNHPPAPGILRQVGGGMPTPATAKKRVQIQEISV
ncbi:neuroligin-1-like [Schistocerca gregaria]|uniref:neuroligin-1-like n=1 Tax=Schistocerca gregaria TaxID=7010 RepID=UPI00211F0D5F|nr:neuroligin-1-like [Schistocerca gregaria]